jgi:hypothetical protein
MSGNKRSASANMSGSKRRSTGSVPASQLVKASQKLASSVFALGEQPDGPHSAARQADCFSRTPHSSGSEEAVPDHHHHQHSSRYNHKHRRMETFTFLALISKK